METPQESAVERYFRARQVREQATDAVKEALEPICALADLYRRSGDWRNIRIGTPDTIYGNPDFRATVAPFEPWEGIRALIAAAHRAEDEEERTYFELSLQERKGVLPPGS